MSKKSNYQNSKLADVYQHTMEYCRKQRYPVYQAIKYDFRKDFLNNEPSEDFCSKPIITVQNADAFELALKMENPLVLNLASDVKSGGGVAKGSRAQEEDLYRRSNYFEANDQSLYPLKVTEIVYSPLVHIIKDRNYNLLQYPHTVSCLAVAAIRNPKLKTLNGDVTYANEADLMLMQEKIDSIFKVAIAYGHTNLVLGALGCGVFNNPTRQVALLFKNAVCKYGERFKNSSFAILSGYGDPNYAVFSEVLGIEL